MRPYLHRWSLLAALALGAVVALAATVPPPAPPKAAATTPKAAPKAKPGVPTPPKSTTPAAPRPALGPPVPLAPTCPVNPLRRHSGHPATKDAIAQWVQQLAAPELVTGWKAAEELVLAGKDATPPLLEVMAGKNIQARRDAAWALGLIRDVSAVPALLDAIQNDGDLSVRTEAVWALGEISDPKAAPALAGQLKVADPAAYYDEMNPGLRPVADVAQEARRRSGPPPWKRSCRWRRMPCRAYACARCICCRCRRCRVPAAPSP